MRNILWTYLYDSKNINIFSAPHTFRISKSSEIRKEWSQCKNIEKVKKKFSEKVAEKFQKDEKFLIFTVPTSTENDQLFIKPLLESVTEKYSNASFQNVFHKKDSSIKFGSDEFKKMSFAEKKELIKIDKISEVDSLIERALIIDDVCSSGESVKFLNDLIKENFKNIKKVDAVVFLKIESPRN